MFPWFWVWAPQLHFPWSGSVAQRIEPNTGWFFDAISKDAGDGRIEKRAFDVASYGRQLGLLTEVLIGVADEQQSLSPEAASSLRRLKVIRAEIEKIKEEETDSLAHEVEERIRRLKQTNTTEFARLSARLRPLLGERSA